MLMSDMGPLRFILIQSTILRTEEANNGYGSLDLASVPLSQWSANVSADLDLFYQHLLIKKFILSTAKQ